MLYGGRLALKWGVGQARQHESAEPLGFVAMRIARQDEGVDAEFAISLKLGEDLIGVANESSAASATRSANAGPQVVLDEAIEIRGFAKFGLASNTYRLTVER